MAFEKANSSEKMKVFLKKVGADFDDIDEVADYLAVRLLSQGICDPNDLGFLCSGQSGVPVSVQQALDPCMSDAGKALLAQACAMQLPMITGVIDVATLALHRPVAGGMSEPAKARHVTGGCLSACESHKHPPSS